MDGLTSTPAVDRRAAILARCDQLELIAKSDDGVWDPLGSGVVTDNQMRRVTSPSPGYWPTVRADAVGVHVAAWDPAAVFALVAGARQLCEIHRPHERDFAHADPDDDRPAGPACVGCRADWQEEWAETASDCPTLAALARMLGAGDA